MSWTRGAVESMQDAVEMIKAAIVGEVRVAVEKSKGDGGDGHVWELEGMEANIMGRWRQAHIDAEAAREAAEETGTEERVAARVAEENARMDSSEAVEERRQWVSGVIGGA